jgi:hypothetical protein
LRRLSAAVKITLPVRNTCPWGSTTSTLTLYVTPSTNGIVDMQTVA